MNRTKMIAITQHKLVIFVCNEVLSIYMCANIEMKFIFILIKYLSSSLSFFHLKKMFSELGLRVFFLFLIVSILVIKK